MDIPKPDNEAERLEAIDACEILDTDPEQIFDDVTQLASQLCDTPISAISLIDSRRQWFKSITGLSATEMSREISFCTYTILLPDIMEVPDALEDNRFKNNPLVTAAPFLRFYAGAPLVTTDGFALGTLCVADQQPRSLSSAQKSALRVLARHVVSQLELRRYAREQREMNASLLKAHAATREIEQKFQTAVGSMREGLIVESRDNGITLCNPSAELILGITGIDLQGKSLLDTSMNFVAENLAPLPKNEHPLIRTLKDGRERSDVVMAVERPDGGLAWLSLSTSALFMGPSLEPYAAVATFSDITERKLAEQEISRLAGIVETSQDSIISCLLDGTVVSWNRGAEKLYGYTQAEMLGRSIAILASPNQRTFSIDMFASISKGAQYDCIQDERMRKDGVALDVSLTFSPVYDSARHVCAVSVIARDVTERSRNLERIRISEYRLAEAQQLAKMGSWEYDPKSQKLTWSAEMYRIYGMDPSEEPTLEKAWTHCHPDDRRGEYFHDAVAEAQGYVSDSRLIEPDGSVKWLHVIARPIHSPSGELERFVGTAMDITDRKQAEQQIEDYNLALQIKMNELSEANKKLEALSTTDGLTGLANHRAFQDRLAAEYARARRYGLSLSLLMIDVDEFKHYNDTFGHPAGDLVLKSVAENLESLLRESDLAARYGGEEFVIILPETSAENAAIIAERVRKTIEDGIWLNRRISISIGVSVLSEDIKDQSEIIARADNALYASKRAGRNRVTFFKPCL